VAAVACLAVPLGSRFNPAEHQITPANVGGLKLKWAFAYPEQAGTPRSQPAVADGTVYFGGPDGTIYTRDARTGAPRWSFDLTSVGTGFTQVQDGPAVARGKVYFGDLRGYLYALDQRTGRLAWVGRLDSTAGALVTSSPIVFGGRVYVGVSSGENVFGKDHACCTFRGHLDALDADTGRPAWRYHTVPKPRRAGSRPSGVARYAPSGGGAVVSHGLLYTQTGYAFTPYPNDRGSALMVFGR
jgi:polyvinyl alcohol dehydrogenase (cytochrome)